jgi:hypothetical protein
LRIGAVPALHLVSRPHIVPAARSIRCCVRMLCPAHAALPDYHRKHTKHQRCCCCCSTTCICCTCVNHTESLLYG